MKTLSRWLINFMQWLNAPPRLNVGLIPEPIPFEEWRQARAELGPEVDQMTAEDWECRRRRA